MSTTLTKAEIATWRSGEQIAAQRQDPDRSRRRCISGLTDMLNNGEKLPVDFTNRLIYYVGPVPPTANEVVGPAGPTTATRMDKFTAQMLEQTGLIGMIGKANRGPDGIAAILRQPGDLSDGSRGGGLSGLQGDHEGPGFWRLRIWGWRRSTNLAGQKNLWATSGSGSLPSA